MTDALVLSCEHATAHVPAPYRELFRGAAAALRSHRGCDLGAIALTRRLARSLGAPLLAAPATRLLADPNRSRRHPRLFSEWSRRLTPAQRAQVLTRYWQPHRAAVEAEVRSRLGPRPVVHCSVHSFTPRMNGVVREVDVALLYDPSRARERAFADRWLAALAARRPDLRLRRNHPYRGIADGLTTHLRRVFAPARYLGIELEVSQALTTTRPADWRRLQSDLEFGLRAALGRIDR